MHHWTTSLCGRLVEKPFFLQPSRALTSGTSFGCLPFLGPQGCALSEFSQLLVVSSPPKRYRYSKLWASPTIHLRHLLPLSQQRLPKQILSLMG